MTNFQTVYEQFQSRISAMIRGTHLPREDQDAINQHVLIDLNTLIESHRWPEAISPQENLVTRLVTCATSKHHKEVGRSRRNRPTSISDITDVSLDHIAWDATEDNPWDTLDEILPTLPEKYREVVELRLQDKPFAEIAQILGISENLANVRHFRAVEKLREANIRRLRSA